MNASIDFKGNIRVLFCSDYPLESLQDYPKLPILPIKIFYGLWKMQTDFKNLLKYVSIFNQRLIRPYYKIYYDIFNTRFIAIIGNSYLQTVTKFLNSVRIFNQIDPSINLHIFTCQQPPCENVPIDAWIDLIENANRIQKFSHISLWITRKYNTVSFVSITK